MRRVLCLALVGAVLVISSGCVQVSKEVVVANRTLVRGATQDTTMTESYTEHLHRLNAVVDTDARGLVDDWDLLMMRDRPTRLTRWHVR